MDSLPNKLLSPILNHANIPFQERIQLRAVASRWQVIIEDALKKQTALVICDNDTPGGMNDLVVKDAEYFNDDLIALLYCLFPSVSQLAVNFSSNEFFAQLPKLLSKYNTTMESFTLDGSYDLEDDFSGSVMSHEGCEKGRARFVLASTVTSKRLAEAINALTSLTSLDLLVRNINAQLLAFLVPTLGRLERYAFRNSDIIMSPNNDWPLKMVASLSTCCTTLNLQSWSYFNPSVVAWSVSFPIHLDTALFTSLSRLKQLTELHLTQVHHISQDLQIPWKSDQPLANVKLLHLNEISISRDHFNGRAFCQKLAAWFPGLERISIHCYSEYVDSIKENLDQFPESVTTHVEGFQRPVEF